MTVTYTFDILSTLDGYGAYGPDGDWGGYWGKQGPELLDRRPTLYDREQRMVFGANTFRQTDVEECACAARESAGDRAVMVHGAGAAQALLRAGLMVEMEIHLVPVLLGEGRRLFERLGGDHVELELFRRLEDRDVTHLRYRVRR